MMGASRQRFVCYVVLGALLCSRLSFGAPSNLDKLKNLAKSPKALIIGGSLLVLAIAVIVVLGLSSRKAPEQKSEKEPQQRKKEKPRIGFDMSFSSPELDAQRKHFEEFQARRRKLETAYKESEEMLNRLKASNDKQKEKAVQEREEDLKSMRDELESFEKQTELLETEVVITEDKLRYKRKEESKVDMYKENKEEKVNEDEQGGINAALQFAAQQQAKGR